MKESAIQSFESGRLFETVLGQISERYTGTRRYAKYRGEFRTCLASQTKPYGISHKHWEILHFGRLTKYGYKMGKPTTIRRRKKPRIKTRDTYQEIRRKSKIKTRSDFDWHLVLQAVKSGWSKARFCRLYECFASQLNVAWHLGLSVEITRSYLEGKYDRARKKIVSAADSKRKTMAKFLHLILEKRKLVGLKNGQIASLLGILFSGQRIAGDEITLSMREISLISCVDFSTVSRGIKAQIEIALQSLSSAIDGRLMPIPIFFQ